MWIGSCGQKNYLKMKIKGLTNSVFIHIAFWILYAMLNYGISIIHSGGENFFLDTVFKYFFAAWLFYTTSALIYPYYLGNRKWGLLIVAMAVLLLVTYIVREAIIMYIYPLFMNEESPYTHAESFVMHLYWYNQYSIIGLGYWFGKETVVKKWEITKLEKEVVISEFNALKTQIDPHFLYNTLNYFYNEALELSDQLANAINDLSDVMRYSIEKKEDNNGEVLLVDEIWNIEKLLSLFKYRFNNSDHIMFNKSGDFSNLRVPPYILTIPVENVFKHGDTTQEIIIDIEFDSKQSCLIIYISNRKNIRATSSTSIGLENLKKRLYYHYADKQQLTVIDNVESFELFIEIFY